MLKPIHLGIVFLISLFLQTNAVNVDEHWCRSCDDPHMTTFDGANFEFQFSIDDAIMYTDYNDKAVYASFRQCNGNQLTPTCNCGVRARNKDTSVFLNVCDIAGNPNTLQFFYYNVPQLVPETLVDCSSVLIPVGDETNDAWWSSNAVDINGDLLCAKSTNEWNTFYIRSNNSNNNDNYYVRLMVHDRGISCIYIRPAVNDFDNTGGLCGRFNENTADDFCYWNLTGTPDGNINGGYSKVETTSMDPNFLQFWQLDKNAPIELEYKKLGLDDCPCEMTTDNFTDHQCGVIISTCGLDALGINYTYQDSVREEMGKGIEWQLAQQMCMDNFRKQKLFEAGLLADNVENLVAWCTDDVHQTGDKFWLVNAIQIGFNIINGECAKMDEALRPPECEQFREPARCSFGDLFGAGSNLIPCPSRPGCKKRK